MRSGVLDLSTTIPRRLSMIRQLAPRKSLALRLGFASVVFAALTVLPLATAADDPLERACMPARTITFRTVNTRDIMDPSAAPKYGYFTNHFLPAEDPESHNLGAFICEPSGGSAAYLEHGQCFFRNLKFLTIRHTQKGVAYYIFEEPGQGSEKKVWAFEINPNAQGNCAIYYQINDGPYTLFQVANKAQIAVRPS
jgi:hypothetical protein